MTHNDPSPKQLLDRISRIEGQVRGIRGMIEDRRGCHDIIKQVAATAGALRALGLVIMEHHLHECVDDTVTGKLSREELVKQLVDIFNRVST